MVPVGFGLQERGIRFEEACVSRDSNKCREYRASDAPLLFHMYRFLLLSVPSTGVSRSQRSLAAWVSAQKNDYMVMHVK